MPEPGYTKNLWNIYTQNLPSAQSYIDFGFYYVIGAALQRRVWYSVEPWQCFPNMYIVFVGPPSAGKGIVIKAVTRFLKHHRKETGAVIRTNTGEEKPLLFATGADSITFEQLIAKMASSVTRMVTPDKQPYFHTSLWFGLDELSSIFKVKTEDVVKFMQNAWESTYYDYEIKHQEKKDRLRNICLSLLAGTQFDFLQKAQRMDIFGQGFSSRTIFLFETRRRFSRFHIAESFTPEQAQAEKELHEWTLKLSKLYGRLSYDKETYDYLETWNAEVLEPQMNRASPKMQEYLGRMQMHIMKMAAAIHFADNLELTISLGTVKKAIEVLFAVQTNMEAGLALIGRNPLHATTKQMLAFIKERKEVTEGELVLAFISEITMDEFKLCLKEMELGYNLKNKLKANGKTVYYL